MSVAEWLLNKLARERHDIGRPGEPDYLTRWVLCGSRFGDSRKVFLHRFLRSDHDVHHDHPWPYTSLILWGGYHEETLTGPPGADGKPTVARRWYGPGSLIRRPATHAHRVILPPGKTCWTLFFPGPKERSWGFHCPGGWRRWTEFQADLDRGGPGCGDAEEVPHAGA